MFQMESRSATYSKLLTNFDNIKNISTKFSFFLKDISDMIRHQFRKHYLYSKGFMLSYLQKRQSRIKFKEIRDLLAHLHIPLIYAYILCGGILLSFLALPYLWSTASCTKKVIDASKLQCCFPVEILCYIFSTVCLMIGIIGTYQIVLEIQNALITLPLIWRNIINILQNYIEVIKIDVQLACDSLKNSTDLINSETTAIPKGILNLITGKLNWNNDKVTLLFEEDIVKGFDAENLGFIFHKNCIEHTLEMSLREIRNKIESVYTALNDIQHNIMINSTTDLTESLQFIQRHMVMAKNIRFPKWKTVYEDLQMVFQQFLPAANDSLFFEKILYTKIDHYTKNELNRSELTMRNLQKLSLEIKRNVSGAAEELFPSELQHTILNITYKIENYMLSLGPIRGTGAGHKLVNGNLWIMMFPPTYALVILLSLVIAFLAGKRELKKIIANKTWSPPSENLSTTLRLFRISTLLSVTLLWLFLILTAVFYCAHLPISVFCEAINDDTIFTEYIDNSYIWNNKTWLDNKLYNYLPNRHRLKIKDVLDKCRENNSIYYSLNMKKHWNVGQCIQNLDMKVNFSILHTMVNTCINEVKTPDVEVRKLLEKLEAIEENLDVPSIPNIMKITEFVYSGMGEDKVTKMIEELPKNILSRDVQRKLKLLVNQIRYINEEQVPHLLNCLSKMIHLKLQIKKMRDKIESFTSLLPNFSSSIQEAQTRTIPNFLKKTSKRLELTITKMQVVTQDNVENIAGDCYAIPFVYNKAAWTICYYGLSLINGAWISFGLISISVASSIIFSCRISGYIRGANSHYCPWRQQLESQTARVNTIAVGDQFEKSPDDTLEI